MVDRDELKDSEYDGIQEYDNDLPRWWVNLFWITIVWGVVYAVWFHLPSTPTPQERLALQMAEIEAKQIKSAPPASNDPAQEEALLISLVGRPEVVKKGSEIYAAKCLACHGPQGQGLVGPNLTDDFWIHGGKVTEIKGVIVNGVLEKGMLAWKAMLTNDEINAVVAFVWSMHGTNPPNPKPAQGAEVKR
jgi:cytochrome c oxidase cbb3-type subunit III